MTSAGRYDEDLDGNLRLVEKLAPNHCVACGGYHLWRARTEMVDMTETRRDMSTDLILLHSLLRFAPIDSHVAIMRRFMSWLRPGGSIIFSHRLMPDRAMQGSAEATYVVVEYQTADQLRTLFGESGLRILSMQEMDEGDNAQARGRKRVVAVLAAGG